MHLKSIISCTGVARKLRFEEISCSFKQSMDRCKLQTSGVWGEAPAANDFGAFFEKRKLLVQLKSACNV